jgi:hypothetical protein
VSEGLAPLARAVMAVGAAVACTAAAAPATAQGWSAEAQAGQLTQEAGHAGVASSSVMLGLRHDGLRSWLGLTAGVPVAATDPVWAGLGAWRRVQWGGPVRIGLDATAQAFGQQDRVAADAPARPQLPIRLPGRPEEPEADLSGHALAGEVLPLVAVASGALSAEARAGVATYRGTFGGTTLERRLVLGDARVALAPASGAWQLGGEARQYRAEEGEYSYAGAHAQVVADRVGAWGSVGRWLSGPGGTPWTVGALLRVNGRMRLSVSARGDSFDPLYGTLARTSWGLGASLRLGHVVAPAAPVPASYVDGRATIALPAGAAAAAAAAEAAAGAGDGAPRVAGDFNDWRPAAMQWDAAGGRWTYEVAVAPGVYGYAFVTAAGSWFVPEGTPGRMDDGMGGHKAVLVVQ